MSIIDPRDIAYSQHRLGEVQANAHGVYWIEQRAQDKGRAVLKQWSGQGKPQPVTPQEFSVGSRVNEYGGGSYFLLDNTIYYADSRANLWRKSTAPDQVWCEIPHRLADPTFTGNSFIFVCETSDTQCLLEISLAGEVLRVVHDDHDFYAAPRFNQETGELAFIAWDLPSMPWDGTHLYVLTLATGKTRHHASSFVSQPTWVNNQLICLSDQTGFGQLVHYQDNEMIPLCRDWPANADAALPLWLLGMQTFCALDTHRFAVMASLQGWYQLILIEQGKHRVLDLPFCAFGEQLAVWQGKLVFSAATPTEGFAIRLLDCDTLQVETISEPAPSLLPLEAISRPEPITFPTSGGAVAHAFFYRPKNPNPPLIVISHGGPTFYTSAAYSNKVQFWTQNGFAVVDVNYRGSTGYGRPYWEALKHCWGEADAQDCIAAAEYLVEKGWVNPEQLFIRGSSAGGFLSLCAMAASSHFKAAAIYYGVTDLKAFMDQTHRFESGYNDWLVGKTVKSPVDQLEKYNRPIIFFHGLKDTVVPVSHSEILVEALRRKGVDTALHLYPEEGHSFRYAETVSDSLTKELEFFRQFL